VGSGISRKTPRGFLSANSLPVLRLLISGKALSVHECFQILPHKGGKKVRQKVQAIQQAAVTDLLSHLSSLPERERDPNDLVGLPDVFRSKGFRAEIRGVLKKGYTFEELAKIFSERCGVTVSERQLKYHYARRTNKPKRERLSSLKPTPNVSLDTNKGNTLPEASPAGKPLKEMKTPSPNDTAEGKVKPGTFFIDARQEEI
jgi:hypothetical protein